LIILKANTEDTSSTGAIVARSVYVRIDEQKKQMVEQTWLHYFNRTLFEQGYISESERNRLSLRIDNRRSHAPVSAEQEASYEPEQSPEQTMQFGM
jgi:hypothetical protein